MRTVIVLPEGSAYSSDRPSSIDTVVRTLCAHSRLADQLTILCEEGADIAEPGVEIVKVRSGLGRRGWIAAVADRLRTLRPDLIEHHQHLTASVELARRLPDVPHVFYRHTRIKPPADLFAAWRYERRLRRFERLVFVSDWARREFAADYPALAERAIAVPNPIDFDAWRGDPDRRENLILFSGRALPDKGLDLFCAALATTLDRHPDWRGALMLGEWERSHAWAEPHVRALERFGSRVEVVKSASRADVMAVTKRAAIAVTPSRVNEALGLTALEAHAAGAALISSGRGGLREASGEHAEFVALEVAELAEAMTRLIDRPDVRTATARAAQIRVECRHAPADRAADLDALRVSLTRPVVGHTPAAPSSHLSTVR